MDVRATRAKTPEAWLAAVPAGTRSLCEEVREWIAEWAPDLTGRSNGTRSGSPVSDRRVAGWVHQACHLVLPSRRRGGGLGWTLPLGRGAQMRAVQIREGDALDRVALRSASAAAVALDAQGKRRHGRVSRGRAPGASAAGGGPEKATRPPQPDSSGFRRVASANTSCGLIR